MPPNASKQGEIDKVKLWAKIIELASDIDSLQDFTDHDKTNVFTGGLDELDVWKKNGSNFWIAETRFTTLDFRRQAVAKSKELRLRINDRNVILRCKGTEIQAAEKNTLLDGLEKANAHVDDQAKIRMNIHKDARTIQVK